MEVQGNYVNRNVYAMCECIIKFFYTSFFFSCIKNSTFCQIYAYKDQKFDKFFLHNWSFYVMYTYTNFSSLETLWHYAGPRKQHPIN